MANWTATLRGLTLGATTGYKITEPGIAGMGVPQARTADQERGGLDGDVGGYDVLPKRTITIPVGVDGGSTGNADTDSAAAWTLFVALKTAWKPSQANIELSMAFAGVTLVYLGRPRGVDADLVYLGKGWVSCLLTFDALLPYAVGEAETVAL